MTTFELVWHSVSLCCAEVVATTEPCEVDHLEMVEIESVTIQPTVVDASELAVLSNEMLTNSDTSDQPVDS